MRAIRVSSTSPGNRNTALDQGTEKHFQLLAFCNFPLQKRASRAEVGGIHTACVSPGGSRRLKGGVSMYVPQVKTECVHACWCQCGIKPTKIKARLLILEIFPVLGCCETLNSRTKTKGQPLRPIAITKTHKVSKRARHR